MKTMNVRKLADAALDLLYPPSLYCICCGNIIDSSRTYNLCDHCIRHIRWDHSAPAIRKGLPMMRCAEYGIYERTLIFSLKYNNKKYIARDIAAMMADRLQEAAGLYGTAFDVIVPVPMNLQKERERGFNQTVLIGRHLGKTMEKDFVPGALVRTRNTRPMRGLSPAERAANIRGSIALGQAADCQRIQGRRVLLLDDFFTTGSTALECRRALEPAGPADVLFFAFAARY